MEGWTYVPCRCRDGGSDFVGGGEKYVRRWRQGGREGVYVTRYRSPSRT